MIDDENPFAPKTFVASAGAAATVSSTMLSNIPNDPNIFVGAVLRNAVREDRIVTAYAAPTLTVASNWGTNPVANDVIEVYRGIHPTQIDNEIRNAWLKLRRKLWVASSQVRFLHEQDQPFLSLPDTWLALTDVQIGSGTVGSYGVLDALIQVRSAYLSRQQNFFDVAANTRIAQSFSLSADSWVRFVAFQVWKVGSPTYNLTLSVQTNAAGAPSGTNVGGTVSIAASDILSTPEWRVFELPYPIRLSASTTYWLELRPSTGSADASNFLIVGMAEDDAAYADGSASRYSGAAWSALSNDCQFAVYSELPYWYTVLPNQWVPTPGRRLGLNADLTWSIDNGVPIRLVGIRYPNEPDETNDIELPFDLLATTVAFTLVAARQKGRTNDNEAMDVRLRTWAAMMSSAEGTAINPWPSNARKVRA